MTTASPFGAFVPGFDFLQGLVKNAGAALPNVGQWVAPTLDPAELEKRINELRTVQFWLEQNARMIGTTIQAMEVQRMTLSTLKNMNVSAQDLREAMTLKMPPAAAPAPTPAPAPTVAAASAGTPASSAAPIPGVVDPMAWWGALTQQFTEIASSAMKDGRAEAARETMGAMMKQSLDAAGETFKQAVTMPAAVAQQAAEAANAAVQASVSAKRARKSSTATPSADATTDASAPAAEDAPTTKPRRTTRKTSD